MACDERKLTGRGFLLETFPGVLMLMHTAGVWVWRKLGGLRRL